MQLLRELLTEGEKLKRAKKSDNKKGTAAKKNKKPAVPAAKVKGSPTPASDVSANKFTLTPADREKLAKVATSKRKRK